MTKHIPADQSQTLRPMRTKQEAAKILRIHVDGVDRLRRRGELRGRKIGSLVRFTDEDLADYIARRREGNAA
jgi:excisionase family DNA binding protein